MRRAESLAGRGGFPLATWGGFVREFLRNPRTVGAVAPSSSVLARAIVEALPAHVSTVVELGPGTGSITGELLAHASCTGRVVALEIDERFCGHLVTRFRDGRLAVLNRPAEELTQVVSELGVPVDAVVTSLPLSNFPAAVRNLIVEGMHEVVRPGGVVVGFSYMPHVVPRVMRERFGNCTTRLVWQNVPPAFVFRSVR